MDGKMDDKVVYLRYRWLMLFATCFCTAAAGYAGGGYAPLLGVIAKSLHVDLGAATQLLTATALVIAVAFVFAGIVCDKCGITFVLVLGCLCASLPGSLLPWIGHSYTNVFIVRLIFGASLGLVVVTIGPLLFLWFSEKERGVAGSILASSMAVGVALSVVSSPAILQAVGNWQKAIALMTIPGWIGLVIAVTITRRPPSPEIVSLASREMKMKHEGISFKNTLMYPVTFVGCFLSVIVNWANMGLHGLVPAYLAVAVPAGLGYGPMMSGKLSFVLLIAGLVGPLMGGVFLDKVAKGSARVVMCIGLFLTGFFIFLCLQSPIYSGVPVLTFCLLMGGSGIAFTAPAMLAFVAANYPPNMIGRMLGLWSGVGAFGGFAGLYLGGVAVSKLGNYFLAVGMISIVCGIGCVLAFFLRPIHRAVPEPVSAPRLL